MRNVLVLGAGKIGSLIAELLSTSGDYLVTVADKNSAALGRLPEHPHLRTLVLDVTETAPLREAMAGQYAVLSASPYQLTRHVAEAARQAGLHYLDLTEDVGSTRLVKSLAAQAQTAFIPQCGLAPGFISIITYAMTQEFERLQNVHMRVGALPKYPANALKYNLTWSTDGLINEYCNPCEAIVEGQLTQTQPLEEVESFSLDGITYEAFNTSGGLGTLCDTLAGKVLNLNYRTVRYPGHRDIMKILLQDLRLRDRRDLLKEILEAALPITYQDVVLIFVTVSGYRNDQLVQEAYAHKIYSQEINATLYSAIQITTAAAICAVLDLLGKGKVPQRGFVRQEDILLSDFLQNRFGRFYARPQDLEPPRAGVA